MVLNLGRILLTEVIPLRSMRKDVDSMLMNGPGERGFVMIVSYESTDCENFTSEEGSFKGLTIETAPVRRPVIDITQRWLGTFKDHILYDIQGVPTWHCGVTDMNGLHYASMRRDIHFNDESSNPDRIEFPPRPVFSAEIQHTGGPEEILLVAWDLDSGKQFGSVAVKPPKSGFKRFFVGSGVPLRWHTRFEIYLHEKTGIKFRNCRMGVFD